MPVVVGTGGGAQLQVFGFELRVVVTEGNQRGSTNSHRIGTQCQRFRHIRPTTNTARDNQLYAVFAVAVNAKVLQGFDCRADGGKDRNTDVFDKHFLRSSGAALHAVEHNYIGTRFNRQRNIVIRPCGADFDVDGFFPVSDFAQFGDFDFEVIRPRPVRVTAGRALVYALRQAAHFGDAFTDFLPQQHTATAGFGSLTNHHLDGIRFA